MITLGLGEIDYINRMITITELSIGKYSFLGPNFLSESDYNNQHDNINRHHIKRIPLYWYFNNEYLYLNVSILSYTLEQRFPTWGTRPPRGTWEVGRGDACFSFIQIFIFNEPFSVLKYSYF